MLDAAPHYHHQNIKWRKFIPPVEFLRLSMPKCIEAFLLTSVGTSKLNHQQQEKNICKEHHQHLPRLHTNCPVGGLYVIPVDCTVIAHYCFWNSSFCWWLRTGCVKFITCSTYFHTSVFHSAHSPLLICYMLRSWETSQAWSAWERLLWYSMCHHDTVTAPNGKLAGD